jgi:hypothetical protein
LNLSQSVRLLPIIWLQATSHMRSGGYPRTVSHGLLGRTNRTFPPVWLSLAAPRGVDPQTLVEAALRANTVLDVTTSPALWSKYIDGARPLLLVRAGDELETATGRGHALDLTQARIIQTLSSVGRPQLDFLCLEIKRNVEGYAVEGALQALEEARQDGHIKYVGLSCAGPAIATLNAWQPHDAFDILITPPQHLESLQAVAGARRAGVVLRTQQPSPDATTLIQVSLAQEIEMLFAGAAA